MKHALALMIAMTMAGPLAAQEVPLNTLTGGGGQEQVDGQALFGGSLLTSATAVLALITAAVVVGSGVGEESPSTP